jgi:hypothetical protein
MEPVDTTGHTGLAGFDMTGHTALTGFDMTGHTALTGCTDSIPLVLLVHRQSNEILH